MATQAWGRERPWVSELAHLGWGKERPWVSELAQGVGVGSDHGWGIYKMSRVDHSPTKNGSMRSREGRAQVSGMQSDGLIKSLMDFVS